MNPIISSESVVGAAIAGAFVVETSAGAFVGAAAACRATLITGEESKDLIENSVIQSINLNQSLPLSPLASSVVATCSNINVNDPADQHSSNQQHTS